MGFFWVHLSSVFCFLLAKFIPQIDPNWRSLISVYRSLGRWGRFMIRLDRFCFQAWTQKNQLALSIPSEIYQTSQKQTQPGNRGSEQWSVGSSQQKSRFDCNEVSILWNIAEWQTCFLFLNKLYFQIYQSNKFIKLCYVYGNFMLFTFLINLSLSLRFYFLWHAILYMEHPLCARPVARGITSLRYRNHTLQTCIC